MADSATVGSRRTGFKDSLEIGLNILRIIATSLVLLLAGALFYEAWDSKSLIIEPVHAPADFAPRGEDGPVLAAQMLDYLNHYYRWSAAYALRKADAIEGDSESGRKVAVPGFGISVSDLVDTLHHALGTEERVTGEIYRADDSPDTVGSTAKRRVVLDLRVNGVALPPVQGDDSALDRVLAAGALEILQETQPGLYATIIAQRGYPEDSEGFLRQLAERQPASEQKWTYAELSAHEVADGKFAIAADDARRALLLDGNQVSAVVNLGLAEFAQGHLQPAFDRYHLAVTLLSPIFLPSDVSRDSATMTGREIDADLAEMDGDFLAAAEIRRQLARTTFHWWNALAAPIIAADHAQAHDLRTARNIMRYVVKVNSTDPHPIPLDCYIQSRMGSLKGAAARARKAQLLKWWDRLPLDVRQDAWSVHNFVTLNFSPPNFLMKTMADDWEPAAADLRAVDPLIKSCGNGEQIRATYLSPWLAYALVRSGQRAAGDRLITTTPRDCAFCLVMRGRIAAYERQFSRADDWFSDALKRAPSSPFASFYWAAELLQRNRPVEAIEKLKLSIFQGPHFADAFELWGEALMKQNRSDRAIEKFETANIYAPSWGHMHLKWGEALAYEGKRDEAMQQFRQATSLECSSVDRRALDSWLRPPRAPKVGSAVSS